MPTKKKTWNQKRAIISAWTTRRPDDSFEQVLKSLRSQQIKREDLQKYYIDPTTIATEKEARSAGSDNGDIADVVVEEFVLAAQFAKKCGGIDEARQMLDYLQKITSEL